MTMRSPLRASDLKRFLSDRDSMPISLQPRLTSIVQFTQSRIGLDQSLVHIFLNDLEEVKEANNDKVGIRSCPKSVMSHTGNERTYEFYPKHTVLHFS